MGVGSFGVDFDELGYYATAGMDRMLAMGRGINMAFRIAFQELGGIWAALGEKMYSLLGNANFTAGMRQQDSGRTWEWLQKTAGQAWVTQATTYQGGLDGGYREGHTADLRQVNRVDWKDYQNLLPGEAVVLLGGRRIYARLFHHPLEITGRPRLCRTLMLDPPDILAVRGPLDRIARVRERVVAGLSSDEPYVPASGVLEGMITALKGGAAKGATAQGCIAAAFAAVGEVLKEEKARAASGLPPAGEGDAGEQDGEDAGDTDDADTDAPPRQPVTEFTPMLDVTATQPPMDSGHSGRPQEPVDAQLLSALIAIEVAAGTPKVSARASAQAALGDRDAALAAISLPEPLPTSDNELRERVDRLCAQFATLGLAEVPDDGHPEPWRDAAE